MKKRVDDHIIDAIISGEGYAYPQSCAVGQDIEDVLALDLADARARIEALEKALQSMRFEAMNHAGYVPREQRQRLDAMIDEAERMLGEVE